MLEPRKVTTIRHFPNLHINDQSVGAKWHVVKPQFPDQLKSGRKLHSCQDNTALPREKPLCEHLQTPAVEYKS
ncbi:hypothetical protein GN956_G13793 [Arapaima gigas]